MTSDTTPQDDELNKILWYLTTDIEPETIIIHGKPEYTVEGDYARTPLTKNLSYARTKSAIEVWRDKQVKEARVDQTFKLLQTLVKTGQISDGVAATTLAVHTARIASLTKTKEDK